MATMPIRKTESPKNLQTCDVCKLRHQKCSGDRPSCTHCELRNLNCVYSAVPAHNVDRSVVRKRSSKPEDGQPTPRNPEFPTYAMKGTTPSTNAPTPLNVLETLPDMGTRPMAGKKAPKPRCPRSSTTASLAHFVDTARDLIAPKIHGGGIARAHVSNSYSEADIPGLWSSGRTRSTLSVGHDRLPSPPRAQFLLDTFLNGVNKLIFVCNPTESRSQLHALLTQDSTTKDNAKALTYLQLCLGAVSSDNATDDECQESFMLGNDYLESALETDVGDWLWVAQANVLVCLYEVGRVPAKCYITLGSAIRIAQTYRIDLSFEESTIQTLEEYSKWRQLWLSMISLDAWLSSILGRTPQINSATSKDPFLKNLNLGYGLPECTVQTSMAKMGVIICRMLKDIHGGRRVEIRAYDQFMAVLERWMKGLPPHLQLAQDTSGGVNIRAQDQAAMFLLKIAHLGGILLLTRPLLLQCAAIEQQQPALNLEPKIRDHAQTCVDAAVRIAYCYSAMKDRGLLSKRSWSAIYLVFHSALTILINMSRRRAQVTPDARQRARNKQEDSSLDICIDILSFCADRDRIAEHLLQILHPLHSALSERKSDFQLSLQPATTTRTQRPSLHPPRSSSSSSAQASNSTSNSTSISTEPSSSLSPSSMDGLEFAGHQAFPDVSFLHPSHNANFTQDKSQSLFIEGLNDWDMDDWLVNPQDIDGHGMNQMPGAL